MLRIMINASHAECVYNDRLFPLLKALGIVHIERATDVEFENGEWVATHRQTGDVIARGPSRDAVIAAEVEWLGNKLRREIESHR